MSGLSNKFVSQSEVDDQRKKRQDEWDKIRKAEDPIECPEAVVDNRSLYDKLQEQKQKKDDDYEEQHKLKNSVKGLDEDEAQFLEFVSNKQIEINKARSQEEQSIFRELKDAAVSKVEPSTSQDSRKTTKTITQPNKKSQTALLAGAVKRKGSGDVEDAKKRKCSEEKSTDDSDAVAVQKLRNQQPKIIGVLPGLGAYDNDTSDSDTSSSDSECDFQLVQRKIKIQIEQQ